MLSRIIREKRRSFLLWLCAPVLMAIGILLSPWGTGAAARQKAELAVSADQMGDGCCWQFTLKQNFGMKGNIVKVVAKVVTPGATVTAAGNPWPTPPTWDSTSITWTMPTPDGLNPVETVTACFNSPLTQTINLVFIGYDAQGNTTPLLAERVTVQASACTRCRVAPCRRPMQIVYEAGRVDDYVQPVDPASPRPALKTFLTNLGGTPADFDDYSGNNHFIHTFGNLPSNIIAATLEIKMAAAGPISSNDALHLDFNGTKFAWGRYIGTGGSSSTSGAEGLLPTPWKFESEHTFTLDLAELPNEDGSITCLLPSLNADRALDIYVQDDTMIDYARLTITVCPCETPALTLTAGAEDEFALPIEKATRGAQLDALLAATQWKDFDNTNTNLSFGHTFSGLPGGIVRAQLEIHLKPVGDADNDALHLNLKSPGGPTQFSWGTYIKDLPGANGIWAGNQPTTFVLDLANLPAGLPGSQTNIIGALADGTLDVYVQDDTVVDYIKLRIWTCPLIRISHDLPVDNN